MYFVQVAPHKYVTQSSKQMISLPQS